ncbi:OTU domain-containing protein At3g57810 isoform X2 [Cynara cardunculus var. scolymus]|uniref:OTU domain-containing protein At3g57810 isoform X2 n=1 Tax=Cynara cardunculus var. scolymus TaxID=59895 RepID=UPI000D62D69A|nr:OTU domain-containing protein At3g57810 isoform X2 [Cynara cardunculus var. scolymus]
MIACSPIRNCVKYAVRPSGSRQSVMPSSACCFHLSLGCVKPNYVPKPNTRQSLIGPSDVANQRSNWQLLTIKSAMHSRRGTPKTRLDLSLGSRNMNLRLLFPKQKQAHAEAKENKEDDCSSTITNFSHGKQVHTNYSVIGIPGDGRCLFRAVAHGACLRSGKPAPSESLQRELADELRARVADEFVKRREETEWFIEGDFDSYVSQIRKTHVWGGEPELLMASHVLKMPISVYMNDQDSGGLISIAEYGHEYSKEDPIRVLYHGFGHYDALHIPGKTDSRARL